MKVLLAICLLVIFTPAIVRAQPSRATSLTRAENREAEQSLSRLGYWTGPIDGRLDEVTRAALVAFQKVDGRKATGQLTRRDLAALARAVPPLPRETGPAHLEVSGTADGSEVRLTWAVVVKDPMLRAGAVLGRPVMQWGHEWVVATGMTQFKKHAFDGRVS